MPKWSELKRFCEHDGWELGCHEDGVIDNVQFPI